MDLSFIIRITVIGLLAGTVGTGSGGLAILFTKEIKPRFLSLILGFAGGMMLDVTFLELIPESIEQGGFFYGITGLAGGIVIFLLLDIALPHFHHYTDESRQGHYRKMGILLGIGIALHNIPEGLAIGTGYVSSESLGVGLALIIGIHNFPEGLAMAVAMDAGGNNKIKTLVATVLAGLPMGLGAFLGAVLGGISPVALSLSLGFAGGAMLFITCDELLPDAHRLSQGYSATVGLLLGVVAGILIIGS
ncbi:MAG: ZIP family metal transporter [Firmicutes bacterium]|nr:ZIP family metal transporter [Bacillota bacterium]